MTSLAEFEKTIGNHNVYLDAYTPGVFGASKIVPELNSGYESYRDNTNSFAFKDDSKQTFEYYMSNNVKSVLNGHILDKKAVYVNETDRERIAPGNYMQFNARGEVPQIVNRQSTVGKFDSGVTHLAYNKNLVENHTGTAFMSTFKQDPRFATGEIRYGANQSVNDRILTHGGGTLASARCGSKFIKNPNLTPKAFQQVNPNRIRLGPECRNPGYLIDGLIENPLSIYTDDKSGHIPQFFQPSNENFPRKHHHVTPAEQSPNTTGVLYSIDKSLTTNPMIYY